MEHFIVSARKYRPQAFKDVVGQQAITNTLENAIANNHLAQALLFCGPRGVGKTSCARILAKRINQDEHTLPDEDFAFNIFELDAASNNSVDDIRSLIDQVRIPPQVGHYKVYIIDEVHMLSQAAFNAFLKTLEEPPKHAIFILATTEKHKIIPTILSRCQIFDFKRITVSDARNHLVQIAQEEGVEAEEEALHIIAQKADGAMRDALSIFDRVVSFSGKTLTRKAVTENLNVLDYDTYITMTGLLLEQQIPQALLALNDILSRGFDGHHFIAGLASHFRDLMVCKNPQTITLLEVGDVTKKKYYEQSQKVDIPFLLRALELANDCDLNYKTSRNQRLLVELCLMQIASITADGEKKNEHSHIIPTTHIEAIPAETIETITSLPEDQQIVEEQEDDRVVTSSGISTQDQEEAQPSISTPIDTVNTTADNTPVLQEEEPAFETPTTPTTTQSVAVPPIDDSRIEEPQQTPVVNSPALPDIDIQKQDKGVSGLSLKSLQKKKDLQEKLAQQQPDYTNLPTNAFTEEAMQTAWKAYVEKLIKKGEKIIASVLEADEPKLKDTVIHLEYPNETMKVEVERAQGALLEHLKKALNNYDITIAITVSEETKRVYAYTNEEKYAQLKTQNPAIDLLRKTFDLDL